MTESHPKKLFLLDAFALIYRAHFAFIRAPRINSKGINTSAIFGFTNSLLEILNKEKPTHLAIVYDTDKPTFRHEEYTEYKANRQEQPTDIGIAIPYIFKIAEGMGIPCIGSDGYEADDIIGTLAKKAVQQGFCVYMMTPDKDFAQLVEPNLFQYKPSLAGKPAEIHKPEDILRNWEIDRVEQVIDILGLMGDAVDNIPGVPGVGEKTAKKLIKEWGSVENMIQNADKISGKLGENVRQFADQAILSKRLATIDINAPVELDEVALEISQPNVPFLKELFQDLEFRQLGARIFGESPAPATSTPTPSKPALPGLFDAVEGTDDTPPPSTFKTINDVPHDYKLVSTAEERKALIEYLKGFKEISFDTETSAVDAHCCDIVGFSFSVKPGEAFYVACNCPEEEARKILEEFREIFEDESVEIIGQNTKFDIMILANYGIKVRGPLFDTMLAHYLIEPDVRHNMDLLSQKFLEYSPISIETLIGKGRAQTSMDKLQPEQIKDYAAEDADVVVQLKTKLAPLLKEQNAERLLKEVELPLVYVLADMERAGVRLDEAALRAYSIDLERDMIELEAKVYELAGMRFNINSPAQLGDILFDKLQLDPKAKRTAKSKQYATGEDVLSALAAKHDIAKTILDYRSLQKLKSTYVDALPQLINKRTGRVHTSYNQAVAATGRLSSTDPNLQNIPIRTDRGREIRKAFIPRDENHIILSADYSQIELRLLAEISQDEAMLKAFEEKEDIHTSTAAKIYSVSAEGVTPEMRRKAKMVNFGIAYGISAFGLAQRLGISRSEAADIINSYNGQYPGIKSYLKNMVEFAREQGYVQTLLGRRRYLRDINSGNATQRGYAERNAINAPIQGTAADMIKVAMINIYKEMEKRRLKSDMILQVHDELVFDTLKEEVDEVKELVEDKMRTALTVKVPIEVEIGTGDNWLEAH